jgi:acetyl-CoA/propionyl-CoA carboxylase biotin carboxyl carrier protein
MQGTVVTVTVAVSEGQPVSKGVVLLVLEAMKMEQPLTAHRSGTIQGLNAAVGATVTSGSTLCEIVD